MKDEYITRLFAMFNIEAGDLERALIFSSPMQQYGAWCTPAALGGLVLGTNRQMSHRIMNRAWTSRPTKTLDKYSRDFTDFARQGSMGFMIGHEAEYTRLVDTLARPINPDALLVGESGVGKETIIAHFAAELVIARVVPILYRFFYIYCVLWCQKLFLFSKT